MLWVVTSEAAQASTNVGFLNALEPCKQMPVCGVHLRFMQMSVTNGTSSMVTECSCKLNDLCVDGITNPKWHGYQCPNGMP